MRRLRMIRLRIRSRLHRAMDDDYVRPYHVTDCRSNIAAANWLLMLGARVLIIEPTSRAVHMWWHEWAAVFTERGGGSDDWRMAIALPSLLKRVDHAAGLDRRAITARLLWLNVSR